MFLNSIKSLILIYVGMKFQRIYQLDSNWKWWHRKSLYLNQNWIFPCSGALLWPGFCTRHYVNSKIKLARLQWLIWKEWSHLMFTNNVEYKVSRFVVNSIFGISIIVFDCKALAKRVSNFMLVQPDVHMSIRNQSCLESGH